MLRRAPGTCSIDQAEADRMAVNVATLYPERRPPESAPDVVRVRYYQLPFRTLINKKFRSCYFADVLILKRTFSYVFSFSDILSLNDRHSSSQRLHVEIRCDCEPAIRIMMTQPDGRKGFCFGSRQDRQS